MMKKYLSLLPLLAMIACFLTVPVLAASPISEKQQILAEEWRQLKPATADLWVRTPSAQPPYAIGELSPDYLSGGLQYLNFLRKLAGVAPVTLSDHLCIQGQYGAVLLAANDVFSHEPQRPYDMDLSFYRMGASACRSGNLSLRHGYPSETLLFSALQGQMDEQEALNRSTLGHRRWLLDSRLGQIGFGLAKSSSGKSYIVIPVSDRSGKKMSDDSVAWPAAGDFPNTVFTPGTPWSVLLNEDFYSIPRPEELSVTVTRLRDGARFTPTLSENESMLNRSVSYMWMDTQPYGSGFCITFSIAPEELGENSYLGDYSVEICGLQTADGHETAMQYTVRFFDPDHVSEPSVWAAEEVQQALELDLLPETLTDLYQQDITRLDYCRLLLKALRRATEMTNDELESTFGVTRTLFPDSDDSDVLTAAALGIVIGNQRGEFMPGGLITRQDAAVMLHRASGLFGITSIGKPIYFADEVDIADYAKAAVSWVSALQDRETGLAVMNGVGHDAFAPRGRYTREQAILTVLRLSRAVQPPMPLIPESDQADTSPFAEPQDATH